VLFLDKLKLKKIPHFSFLKFKKEEEEQFK